MPSFCAQCGTALKLDAQFCEECGAAVGRTIAQSVSSSARGLRSGIWLWFVMGGGAVLLIVGGLVFSLPDWVDPDKRANQLFVEASQLVQAAQQAEQTSYVEAFKLYQAAQANLETITARYPSSQIAVQLIQGQAKIGPYTIAQFREAVRYIQARAEAEGDPLACALLVVRTIRNHQGLHSSRKVKVLAEVAHLYAKSGDTERAQELFAKALQTASTLTDAAWKVQALTGIAAAYAEASDEGRATELFSQALQTTGTITDATAKSEALFVIAAAAAKVGRYDQAMPITNTLTDAAWKARAWAGIAAAYTKAGDTRKAKELFSQALQTAGAISNAAWKAQTWAGISMAYAETGDIQEAMVLITRALQATSTLTDAAWKAWASAGIAVASAKVGQYDQALQMANTLTDAAWKAWASTEIATAFAKAGRYDQAMQVTSTITDTAWKAWALVEITSALARAGQSKDERTKKILHIIIDTIDLSSGLEGKGSKPEEVILGEWMNVNSRERVEFFKDGTVNFLSGGSPMGGDYKIVDDTHVRLHLGGFGGLAGPMVWKFSISGDQLIFNLPDGKVAIYRRTK